MKAVEKLNELYEMLNKDKGLYLQQLDNYGEFLTNEDESAEDWFGHADDCLSKGVDFGRAELAIFLLEFLESNNE